MNMALYRKQCVGLAAAIGMGAASAFGAAVQTTQPKTVTLRRSTTQPATVHAFYEAEVHAKVSGYLKSVEADIGDAVKAGQTLAVVDVPEMAKGYESQQAEVARLESARKQYRAAVEVARARIERARADVGKAKAEADAVILEFKRIQSLVKTKAVTQRLADESLSRKLAAEADLASVRASEVVAKANLTAAEADAAAADAAAIVARKRLEEMEVLMHYATLKAPFDGVVTERNVDPGDLVRNAANTGAVGQPLFGVAQVDKMRVRVPVPERDAIYVNVGDAVEFSCKAFGSEVIKAKVSRVARRLDPKTRSMLVEIDLPNDQGRLLPGMYGAVTILLDEKPDTVVVPSGSIRFNDDGSESVVYVLQGGATIAHVPVKVGYDNGVDVEILSGLKGSEQIVTGMLGRLKDGAEVSVVNR